jgi:hypothetical protein
MGEDERRADSANRQRLDRIALGYQRWSARTLILLAILATVQLACGGLTFYLLGQNRQRIAENRDRIADIRKIAERANDKANDARVLNALQREKVCTATNDTDACRALYERLSRNLTDGQRLRLACAVLDQFRGEEAARIKAKTPCK